MASEATTATLAVTNTGTLIGGEMLHLYVDGETVANRFARVLAHNTEQIDLPLQFDTPGTYEVAVGRSSDDIIASETVTVVPKSTEFEWLSFEEFELTKQVEQGTTVEVTGTVTNTGDKETLQVVKMTVDADVVDATKIGLESSKSTEVTVNYTFETPGEYTVAIEDLGPWTVVVPEPGATNGT